MMKPNSDAANKAVDTVRKSQSMKPKSIRDWYRILRVRHRFSRIQSIRFALWLHAGV
jgi:hypothetical protein